MDFNPISHRVVDLTPEEARRIRTEHPYPRQRAIDDKTVKKYMEHMRLGTFRRGTVYELCELPDGQRFTVNGNHTLEAVASGTIAVTLTELINRVPDMETVHEVYKSHDRHKRRSNRVMALAHGIDMVVYALIRGAPPFILSEFQGSAFGKEYPDAARHALIEDFAPEAYILLDLLQGIPKERSTKIKRGAVIAVALVTLRDAPAKAIEFWRALIQDDGLTKGHPAKALLTWLRTDAALRDQTKMPYMVALAWNIFYAKKTITRLQHKNLPVIIAGTRWNRAGRAQQPTKPRRTVATSARV